MDITSVDVLIIFYHLGLEEIGFIPKEQFVDRLTELKLKTLEDISDKIGEFKGLLSDPEVFKNIYKFAFNINKDNPDSRNICMLYFTLLTLSY